MASAREVLNRSKALQEAGQAEEALQVAKEALESFRTLAQQTGVAEALRHVVGGQIQLLEVTTDEAQRMLKDEAARVRKSAADGKETMALMGLATAEIHLFKGESDKALKAATEAAKVFQEEADAVNEAEALQMQVNAQLMRSNTPKALIAANAALSAAQKAGDLKVEGSAWLSVATARHVSGGEDAKEAAQRALGVFRELGDRANEGAALLLSAQVELSTGDPQVALNVAQEALSIAKEMGNGPQAASAAEVVVEAHLANSNKEAGLSEAEGVLAWVEEKAGGKPLKGVASAMSAVLLARTACKGIDSAVDELKKFVVQLRERGDQRGEVQMLHKLGTMSSIPEEAMVSAQAALALAQKIGDASQEAAIKTSITDLYAAKGRVERAPTRKAALKALTELVKALESKDGDKFDDDAKYLDGFYNALKQEDVENALVQVMATDPPGYTAFLQEHGHMLTDDKPQVVSGWRGKTAPHLFFYYNFTSSGISYGPRFRINEGPWRRYDSETATLGLVELTQDSAQWERSLLYNPSLLDGCLQHTSAFGL